MFALPGGFLGAIATWIVNRKYRNNDFLSQLQNSIDLLTDKYTKALDELTLLKQEKSDWQIAQKQLIKKVEVLTSEVKRLNERIKNYEGNK